MRWICRPLLAFKYAHFGYSIGNCLDHLHSKDDLTLDYIIREGIKSIRTDAFQRDQHVLDVLHQRWHSAVPGQFQSWLQIRNPQEVQYPDFPRPIHHVQCPVVQARWLYALFYDASLHRIGPLDQLYVCYVRKFD
jgi:hypothetical protein